MCSSQGFSKSQKDDDVTHDDNLYVPSNVVGPEAEEAATTSPHPWLDHLHETHVNSFAPKIIVVGVGGAGGNAVNNMIARGLHGVDFLVCNTDAQHLKTTLTDNRIQMGSELTGGLGCGANPDAG
ncbi:hypothetical protein B5M09_002404 [Aphanomyces astaci]|uniref:Tubulin/FtsZ GTPase domain-containing protein n=1 Tax=Aphanomyces astaci TaxID=112090 RepID=A0A3R7ZF59_APHAT|nr:hypothetical protein B5M09_002404 [Aphanomyces astaci]